jgi:hypothetical protein
VTIVTVTALTAIFSVVRAFEFENGQAKMTAGDWAPAGNDRIRAMHTVTHIAIPVVLICLAVIIGHEAYLIRKSRR